MSSPAGVSLVLVADSRAAPPLAFSIDAGPFVPFAASSISSHGGDERAALLALCAAVRVGLRCSIRATTVYRVMASASISGSEGEDLQQICRVAATYVAHVAWLDEEEPAGGKPRTYFERCGHSGRVEIQILPD